MARGNQSHIIYRLFFFLSLLILFQTSECRRRVSQAGKAFHHQVKLDWNPEESEEIELDDDHVTLSEIITPSSIDIVTTTPTATTTEEPDSSIEDEAAKLLEAVMDVNNITMTAEYKFGNSSIYWIDASYKALDMKLNVSDYKECKAWRSFWNITVTNTEEKMGNDSKTKEDKKDKDDLESHRKEVEIIDSKKRLTVLGISDKLLEDYKAVGVVFKEICGEHGREKWFRGTDDAKRLGITEASPICEPFKEALNPDVMTLAKLAHAINDLIEARTGGILPSPVTRATVKHFSTEATTQPSTTTTMREFTIIDHTSTFKPEILTIPRNIQPSLVHELNLKNQQRGYNPHHIPLVPHVSPAPHTSHASHTPPSTHPPHASGNPPGENGEIRSTTHPDESRNNHVTHPYHTYNNEETLKSSSSELNLEVVPLSTTHSPQDLEVSSIKALLIENEKLEQEEDAIDINNEVDDDDDKSSEYFYEIKKENEFSTSRPAHSEPSEYIEEEPEKNVNMDEIVYDYDEMYRKLSILRNKHKHGKRKVLLRLKRETEEFKDDDDDDDWLGEAGTSGTTSTLLNEVEQLNSNLTEDEYYHWVEINATDEINPTMLFNSMEAVEAIGLNIQKEVFLRYQKVGLYLPGICADYVPKSIDAFNSSSFEGIKIDGPIGVNISALEAAGVNLTALAEKLRNDTEVDDILSRTEGAVKTLGGSFILPVLEKNQYDPFSAPIVFQGSAVVVRFGIYIESISNFQTSTMDYDMDIYLMMSWRDARLVNPYDKPILVKEEEILEKIWRPDPFFANAKEAEFHEVTFLNFLMRIYPDGLVLYETRVKITPSCNLILCKYPHDRQTCDLVIKSFAYPIETVRFEWFSRRKDAIDKNPDVKLPELYISRYEPTVCNKTRKSGEFSCLRAVFRLKRDVGFHIAQTYIPTSLALMFSWVGVWLPEEFMEGRIGVAITVLLTLSTESAGAREHLPSVSYLKAIDLWFGFITGFVFFTLLQTLFVIGFDKRANQLRKWAMKKKLDVTEELRDAMLDKARRYHKTGRYLDNFCRVFYPLSFILFLIMYYFVFTEGQQDDCVLRR